MGFLANLVPGVRDLRVPLTVGVMWFVVGWLAYPMIPAELSDNPLMERLQQIPQDVNDAALFPLLAFGAYLLGMLMEPIGRVLQVIWIALALFVPVAIVVVLLSLALPALLFRLSRGAVLVVPLLVGVWYLRASTERRRYFREWAALRAQLLKVYWLALWQSVFSRIVGIVTPNYVARREFIAERCDLMAKSDAETWKRLELQLSPRRLQLLIERLTVGGLAGNARSKNGGVFDVDGLVRTPLLDDEQVSALRNFLYARLQSDAGARKLVYFEYAELQEMDQATDRELRRATALLRANHEKVFEEFDRLMSEAELRMSIAAPVGVAASLAILIAEPDNNGLAFFGGLVPLLILLARGALRRDTAQHLLLSYIQAGLCPVDESYFGASKQIRWKPEDLPSPKKLKLYQRWLRALNRVKRGRGRGAGLIPGHGVNEEAPQPLESSAQ